MLLDDKVIDIFVASRIGSFKHIQYHTDSTKNNKKCIENLQDIKSLVKDDAITSFVWGNEEQVEVLIGRKNQQVQIYNTAEAKITKSVTADFGKGEVVGLGKYKRRLITALSSGVVKIWSKKKEKEVVLETGGLLDRLRMCEDDALVFGTGGNENELKLWRIGESTPIFHAKNLSNDWLQLRQPVWVTDLCFIPGNDGKVIATCSRHGYVRLYDTRAQRRPVSNVEFKAMAATCIKNSFIDRQVLVGFGRGQLHQVDLRQNRPDKGFKGNVGAVTDVSVVASPKLVVSVSLDRHIKVHDFDSKQLLYKHYLTSKLSGVLVQSASTTPLQSSETEIKDETEIKSEDEMDELFDNMETVRDKSILKKHREQNVPAKKMKVESADPEAAIVKLLKSTEKQKKRMLERKKLKKAKSLYHNA